MRVALGLGLMALASFMGSFLGELTWQLVFAGRH